MRSATDEQTYHIAKHLVEGSTDMDTQYHGTTRQRVGRVPLCQHTKTAKLNKSGGVSQTCFFPIKKEKRAEFRATARREQYKKH